MRGGGLDCASPPSKPVLAVRPKEGNAGMLSDAETALPRLAFASVVGLGGELPMTGLVDLLAPTDELASRELGHGLGAREGFLDPS